MTVVITTNADPQDPTLTTEQVKSWLNLPAYQDRDDTLIRDVIIPDVLDYLSRQTGVSYVKRGHLVQAACFEELDFKLVGSGHAGWALSYYNAADSVVTVDAADYRVEVIGDRVLVELVGGGFPALQSTRAAPVELRFTTETTIDGTPRLAALTLCALRYANRGDDWSERIPPSVTGMIHTLTPRRAH